MLSYWEKTYFTNQDHIIVGGGLSGLFTAYFLRKKYPNDNILILEKSYFSSAASSRNAGFACMGSASELLENLKNENEEKVVALYQDRKKGLELMRELLGDNEIGYEENGSYEWLNENEKNVLDKISYLNKLLFPIIGKNSFELANEKIIDFGFASSCFSLIKNNNEGEINTGKLLQVLRKKIQSLNVEFAYGCSVKDFNGSQNKVTVLVKDHFNTFEINCKNLMLCTNAFSKKLLPNIDLKPGRGQILITKPIENLKLKGIFHMDKGYFYFREIDGRILFGGGRNLDIETEATDEFGENEKIIEHLKLKLTEDILRNTRFEIDYTWSGIMAFGESKLPLIEKIAPGVFMAIRCGGMGVALSSLNAKKMVDLITD